LSAQCDDRERRIEELTLCGFATEQDRTLYAFPLEQPRDLWSWLKSFANTAEHAILEIGSREVVTRSPARELLPLSSYTGFDFHPGPNVDVVGDVHQLSSHFPPHSFDVVISIAVFEHLAMPWVVAEEISQVLKMGGVACIYTHFSWSEHETPWHFFQFNSNGLKVLFNSGLGFEVIEAHKSMPMVGRFGFDCDEHHAGKLIAHLYCSSNIIARKVSEPHNFSWRGSLDSVYGETEYPAGTSVIKGDVPDS
jgi:hypothetical protein